MKIKILKSAREDFLAGYQFYESQEKGLGLYFIDALFSDIDSLLIYAGVHSIHFSKYYRLLSKRFPYAVYYRIQNNQILIHAVFDCRQNPDVIKKRLKKR